MLRGLRSLWTPGAYHDPGTGSTYFEGWYVKLISRSRQDRWAVIPGIFRHPDPSRAHAFIQVLDGMNSQVVYHRFPEGDFEASTDAFDLRIGPNRFHSGGCSLDINSEDQRIAGRLKFGELIPWPVRFFSPGVMGPFGLIPFLQTYHGVLSLDHGLQGQLLINDRQVDFQEGRGYLEKDWGTTFPRAYIWMQSNHFPEPGVSLTASVATIPWLGGWFRGFLVGFYFQKKLYRFTTYLGAEIKDLKLTDSHVTWILQGKNRTDPERRYPGYQLLIRAEKGQGGLLSSPELDGMTPRILESLTAEVEVQLTALNGDGDPRQVLYSGTGSCTGLEVAGSVSEIVDH